MADAAQDAASTDSSPWPPWPPWPALAALPGMWGQFFSLFTAAAALGSCPLGNGTCSDWLPARSGCFAAGIFRRARVLTLCLIGQARMTYLRGFALWGSPIGAKLGASEHSVARGRAEDAAAGRRLVGRRGSRGSSCQVGKRDANKQYSSSGRWAGEKERGRRAEISRRCRNGANGRWAV